MTSSICAITLIRITLITEIHGHNTMQQYLSIPLVTCLEPLLGIINACLPVTKPAFSKIGAASIFGLSWSRAPIPTKGKPKNTPRLNHVDQVSRGGEKHPAISRPKQILHRDSLHVSCPDLAADVHAPSIPPPSFSWRPLSDFYIPRVDWEHDPADLRKDKRISITTDWDVGRRPSEGDSPTIPWQPQWHSRHKITIKT